jgi:RNA recognition motif-containing protein
MADDNNNCKLYVGNLDPSVTEEDIRVVFDDYGDIEAVDVIMDPNTGEPKGFAFVTFVNEEDAAKAERDTNNKDMKGKPMKVNKARPKS